MYAIQGATETIHIDDEISAFDNDEIELAQQSRDDRTRKSLSFL